MDAAMYTWHKIAESMAALAIAPTGIAVVEAGGKKICIARVGDSLFAISYLCPHAGGIMANGYLDGQGHIVCPMHCYKFDMRNGRNVSGEGYFLKHWPVEIRPEGVFVGM